MTREEMWLDIFNNGPMPPNDCGMEDGVLAAGWVALYADAALAEYDKRFPPKVEAIPSFACKLWTGKAGDGDMNNPANWSDPTTYDQIQKLAKEMPPTPSYFDEAAIRQAGREMGREERLVAAAREIVECRRCHDTKRYEEHGLDGLRKALALYDGETQPEKEPDFDMPLLDCGSYKWSDGSGVHFYPERGWYAMKPSGHSAHTGYRRSPRAAAMELYRLGVGPGAKHEQAR